MIPTENLIISPLSAANSLALLTQATNGTTHDEIRKGLHLSSNKSVIANQFHKLYSEIQIDNYTITTVNQIYVQEECTIKKKFKQIANTMFMSGVEHLDFRQRNDSAGTINRFVEKNTNKTVRNLEMPSMLSKKTKLVLVNTIHFNNNWLFPFEKECTYRGDFFISENETVEVEYMCIKTRNVYGPIHNYHRSYDLDVSAVELYFGNTNFSMVIILPNNRTGLTDLEAKLGDERPYLTIPKFEIEFDIELNPILKNVCTLIMYQFHSAKLHLKYIHRFPVYS